MFDPKDVSLISELEAVLDWTPMTGAEVVEQGLTGVWSDLNIGDVEEWVRKVRETMWNRTILLGSLHVKPY